MKITTFLIAALAAAPVRGQEQRGVSFEERRLATIEEGRKVTDVRFAREGFDYEFVCSPEFSPDGKVVAYQAWKGDKALVVVGNRKGEWFDDVDKPVFGPDGKVVAYAAREGDKWRVVVGEKPFDPAQGKKGEEFDSVEEPQFSPDGTKVAFGARKGRELWWKVMAVK